ncbi:MAG: DNA-3-methyladenine glycosylase [Candidatus Pacearchaeota archaeon]
MRPEKEFFSRPADRVARDLLGKILVRRFGGKLLKAKIVETEAYFGESDPASRAVQNGDLRKTMLMVPGTILVYGVHDNWILNFVTKEEGKAEAVLIRALEPLNFDLNTKGPGLLTKAMNIDKKFHKENAFDSEDLWLEGNNDVFEIGEDFRIGVRKDLPKKFRFYIKGNKHISRK